MQAIIERILRHRFFARMEQQFVPVIVRNARERVFTPGEMIFREGEPATKFYLIETGQIIVEAHKPADGIFPIEKLHPGEVLGWSWLYPPFVRQFQARALEVACVIELDGANLLAAADQNKWFGYDLLRRVSRTMMQGLQAARKRLIERENESSPVIEGVLAHSQHAELADDNLIISKPVDSAARVRADRERPEGDVMVIHDVTALRQAEHALHQREEQYRTLFELAAAGMAEQDLQSGRFLRVNRKMTKMLGYSEAELLTLTFLDITHPDDRASDSALLKCASRDCVGDCSTEKRYVRKDGTTLWASVSRQVMPPGNPNARVLVVADDITRRKKLEVMAESSLALLESLVTKRTAELQKSMRCMEVFCYGIAHELRGPLRAIEGFSKILPEGRAESDRQLQRDLHTRISNAVGRMNLLISDLLRFGSLVHTEFKMVPVDLQQQMDLCIEQIRADRSNAPPQLSVKSSLPRVLGDPSIVRQILINLLSNAVKFVAPGTSPRVCIWAEKRPSTVVRVWIEDNGIGIAPEFHKKIFHLFQRLVPAAGYEGTGVGLALVKTGVERIGGAVGVESEAGKGSRFWVEFKAADDTQPAPEQSLSPAQPQQRPV